MISIVRGRLFQKSIVPLIWLGLWTAASAFVGQTLLLPSPLATGLALLQLIQKADFWVSVWMSVARIGAGFALGVSVGVAFALLAYRFVFFRRFCAPFVSAIKAAPVVSFIMLAYVWMKAGGIPIFTASLIVLPIAWENLSAGLAAMDPLLLEMGNAYHLTKARKVKALYWPMLKPYTYASIASGMGMAWKAGIAAEVISTPRDALGSWIYRAKMYLDTPGLFAVTAVVIILSVLIEKIVLCSLRSQQRGQSVD